MQEVLVLKKVSRQFFGVKNVSSSFCCKKQQERQTNGQQVQNLFLIKKVGRIKEPTCFGGSNTRPSSGLMLQQVCEWAKSIKLQVEAIHQQFLKQSSIQK